MMSKIAKITFLICLFLGTLQFHSQAQIGGLKKKIGKITKKKNTNSNEHKNTQNKSIQTNSINPTNQVDEEYDAYISEKYKQLSEMAKIIEYQPHMLKISSFEKAKVKAQTLNYPEVYTKVKDKAPSSKIRGQHKYLLDFQETGGVSLGNKPKFRAILIAHANESYDEAYKAKNLEDQANAFNLIKEGKLCCEILALTFPERADVKEVIQLINQGYKDLVGTRQGELYVSKIHQENAGKILFSKQPIIPGKENATQFTTEFSPQDKIYAIAYFDGGTMDQLSHISKYNDLINGRYEVNVDEADWEHIKYTIQPETYDQTYTLIEIIPAPSKAIHPTNAMDWSKILTGLSPRKHTITVEFKAQSKTLAQSDKITLNWTGLDARKLEANAKNAIKQAEDNYARVRNLPKLFSFKTEQFKDSQLSHANIIQLYKKLNPKCGQILKLHTNIFKNHSGGADWEVKTNDLDVPTAKVQNGNIGLIYKGNDGWCYFVEEIFIKQQYLGGGRYGQTTMSYASTPQKIACDRVK